MKRIFFVSICSILILCTISSISFAFTSKSFARRINVVQEEIADLEADIPKIQTRSALSRAKKKLRKYKSELRQLQWDYQAAVKREKASRDKKLLNRHR